MTRYELELQLPTDFESRLLGAVTNALDVFPNQASAIRMIAEAAHYRWIQYASGKVPLPNGKTLGRVSGAYASSIKIAENGFLKYVIFSDDPKARWIEDGFPEWDMHQLLTSSHKVRVSKKGKKYLIIPFRHGTPGALGVVMPKTLYRYWMVPDRKSSVISGQYLQRSVQDHATPVTRRTYMWGDRVTRKDVEKLGLDPSGLGRNLVGMVRFQNNEDRGGQYLTFRVLGEDSKGWVRPARQGFKIAQSVYEYVQREGQKLMQIAIEEDLKRLKIT